MMYTALVIFTTLSLLTTGGRGQQCPVHQDCTCSPQNGTDITCNSLQGDTIPKFLPTDIYFRWLYVRSGTVNSIQTRAFEDLHITGLEIIGARIPTLGCSDFAGLENSLTQLTYRSSSTLTAVPRCALSPLTRLTQLFLYSNRITGLTSEDFGTLVLLEVLNLSGNQIMRIDPDAFKGLVNLEKLYLHTNKLANLTGLPFRTLTNLTTLTLQNNNLVSLNAGAFDGLYKLQSLSLDNNNIEDFAEGIFRDVTNLETFTARNNKLSRLRTSVFSTLDKLTTLYLSMNKLMGIPEDVFNHTTSLRNLDLSNAFLSNSALGAISRINTLGSLTLNNDQNTNPDSGNYFEGFLTDVFQQWPNIATIQLRNNSIKYLQPGAFRNLIGLSTLDLTDNNLMEIPSYLITNSPGLRDLRFTNNEITDIHESMFDILTPRLYRLDLSGNQLSRESSYRLKETLHRLTGLQFLYLTDMQLPQLEADIVTSFSQMAGVQLRNCSLNESTYFSGSTLPADIDVSDNDLKKFGKRQESVTINRSQRVNANVSHNSLSEINIELSYYTTTSYLYLHAQNNNLREVVVNASHRVIIPIFDLSHNSISSPVVVPTQASVTVVNLSFNKMSTVTQFPLVNAADVGDLDGLDPCSSLEVATLNLSRNLIASISPEACLGLVTTLDLSHNQLQTLSSLLPTTTSSSMRLQSLYLTGNRLHALTPTLVWEPQLDLYEFLYRNSRFRMYLDDNPLSCDCTGAWMRNGSVPEKLVSARCQSPRDIRLYLVQCYPIDMCGANITSYVKVSSGTNTLCEEDPEIGIEEFTYRKQDDKIWAQWVTFGPGSARGFRLVYHDLLNPDNVTQDLIHPALRSVVLDDLLHGHDYRVCISGEKSDQSETAPVCMDIPGHPSTTGQTDGVGLPARPPPQEVIGLSVGLGVCVLLLLGLSLCVIGRRYNTPVCCKTSPTASDTSVKVNPPEYENVSHPEVSRNSGMSEYDYIS